MPEPTPKTKHVFDPSKVNIAPSSQDATIATAPDTTFDPGKVNLVPATPGSNVNNTGLGAAGGSVLAGLTEFMGPGKLKAMEVATKGTRLEKAMQALGMESKIARGALIGDLGETTVRNIASGNIALAAKSGKAGVEFLRDAGISALEEAGKSIGLGLPLRGVGGGLNKILFRPSATQSPEVNLAYEVLGDAMKKEGFPPLTLAAATDSKFIDAIDNATRAAVGGGRMTNFDQTASRVVNTLLDKYSDALGPRESANALVQNLFDILMHQEQIGDLPAVVMRQTITRQADNAGVAFTVDPLVEFIQKNVDDIDALGGFGKSVSGVTASKALLNITDNPTATNMLQLRSIAKATIRSLEADKVTAATPQVGMFKMIAQLSDQALKKGLKEADQAVNAERRARGLSPSPASESMLGMMEKSDVAFAKHHERFFNTIQKKIMKSIKLKGGGTPDALADLMMKPEGKNSLEFVRSAKAAWPASEWPRVQRAVIERMRDKFTKFRTGEIDGEGFAKMFSEATDFGAPKRIGRESLKEIFGPSLTKKLTKLADAIEFAQRENPTNVLGVGASLAQGGGILTGVGFIAAGEPGYGATLLGLMFGLPWLGARFLTSEKAVEAVTKGLTMKPLNPAWPALGARIYSLYKAAERAERRENPPPQRTVGAQPTLQQPQGIAIQQ
jgi:hypothetical protein